MLHNTSPVNIETRNEDILDMVLAALPRIL